jgi:hypothetical protein
VSFDSLILVRCILGEDFGLLFFTELNVHITDHVVGKVITHISTLNFPIFASLFEDVFV